MSDNRKEFFIQLKENAEKIKETLNSDNLQLAKLDNLFRERNRIFIELKDLLVAKSIDKEEESMMQEMIEDNRFILDEMEKIKQDMESAFHKKENDANKISKYSPKNLKG